ncbi:hypothetical protein B0I37DRAFT_22148 [Chaetomium sp. MPI-CAGE-AT-0009]|nr:hypothetical protein B0I37DRAFT_22148 [Chaetomium sp. MPI-CAGE-AT-0009]
MMLTTVTTCAGLETLPTELLISIIKQLSKADLKALSLVSKKCHYIVAEPLWKSAIIKPLSERHLHQINAAALPQSLFQFAQQVHFRSDFRIVLKNRCPHYQDARGDDGSDPSRIDKEGDSHVGSRPGVEEDGDKRTQRFHDLAQQAKSTLGRFQPDQLCAFSWDFGACVPSEVLGPSGTIPLNNPSLRSLNLTTDPTCHSSGAQHCEIDLSALCQLQSLRWRGPGARHLDTLSRTIENNSGRLRSLELDFICWASLKRDLDFDQGIRLEADEWCANNVFGLTRQSPQPTLSAIRELSLAQVPLGDGIGRTINFDTLVSLKLRNCRNWDDFLDEIIHLGVPIRLKTFEIRDSEYVTGYGAPETLNRFLTTFDGLEELFVSYWNSEKGDYRGRWNHVTSGIWNSANHHRETLKRLGYHRRERVWIGPESDLQDEGLYMWGISETQDNPSQHPLADLDLDFIGLSCSPGLLGTILLPFSSKESLKVIHIRQSGVGWSWVIEDDEINPGFFRMTPEERRKAVDEQERKESGHGVESGHVSTADEYDAALRARIQPEFGELAEWAFGPRGICSLQAIAYGDFSRGGRMGRSREVDQLLVCRNTHTGDGEHSNFRIVRKDDPEARVLDKYDDALQALPMEPLML